MIVPIHSFIWKIASRCNLNCSYCFVYNLADSRWQKQPKLMSKETARQTARRIREHCEAHEKKTVSIVFHGGEPLIGGLEHLRGLLAIIGEEFAGSGIKPSIGMQSNGLLFTPEIGDLFLENGATIGISIDGPPEFNDVYRLDLQGRPSTARLEEKLRILMSPAYRKIFSGFLMVVNIDADPIRVIDYLMSFDPGGIDFILPYDNHDRRPKGKADFEATPYADWLIRLFDYWYQGNVNVRIREFDSIISLLLRGRSQVESIGLGPVDLIVVETNGEIEAVDSLKGTFEGAAVLGYNVVDHDFDTVAKHTAVVNRHLGADSLCHQCQGCPVVDFCGGGYLPNRYSAARGFDNTSIYCRDLEKVIRHIHGVVSQEFAAAGVMQ